MRDPAFLDLFDHLKARASLAPEAADLPASERGTDEYERLVEEFVVPVWREHAPGTTASDLGDWKRPPPEDSEADDGRLVEPAKVVNLPRALAVRPRMRLEPVSGYDIAPAGPGGLRFGRPDPREIHGQLMGPYTVEDSAGEDVVDKISPSARLAAKLRAADARKHALRSNELFQQDGAPKRLLEVTAAHRAVEIAEAGGLRRRLRAQRFRKWRSGARYPSQLEVPCEHARCIWRAGARRTSGGGGGGRHARSRAQRGAVTSFFVTFLNSI